MAKKITETGPYSYRQLQKENMLWQNAMADQSVYANVKPLYVPRSLTNDAIYEGYEKSPILQQGTGDFFGNSIWDNKTITEDEWEKMQINPNEQRALNEWTIAKWGAGILKGVGLAGTTFLDGTVGAIWGLVEGAIAAYEDEGDGWDKAKAFFSNAFNNSFSKELRNINLAMEEILPNYRTQDEIENPMALRNLLSANTLADGLLKNMGFTVGAFYSGNAFLGALKGLKAAKYLSNTAGKAVGSLVQGVNEGRIEAGNNYDELVKAETNTLRTEYEIEYNRIMSEPDTMEMTDEGVEVSSRLLKLKALLERFKKTKEDIRKRASNAALLTLAGNAIFLPFTDMYAYGKLYARGFKPKSDLAGVVTGGKKTAKKAIDQAAEAAEGIGNRITRNAKGYGLNKITNKEAIGRGLKTMASQGSEEMNQNFISSLSTNWFAPDSPDAYYNALTNDDYEMKTKDFMTSLAEGFMDSWGNPNTYKEFIMGAVTGALGMPTFGRVNNSDANTYLGRGKSIGLSGGIFGEISNAHALNLLGQLTVDAMNKFLKQINDTKEFFVRSQSFTDAMDGYLKEGNKFQYQNAKDNDTFNAILAFSRAGRLQDFRDLVNEDFENISDEQLEDIAKNTTSEDNKWINPADGSLLSSTEEGRKEMRKILEEKRKDIITSINSFEDALETVRAIGNNSLTDDLTAELAWLKWKLNKFEQRYKEIKEGSEDDKTIMKTSEFITNLREAIDTFLGGKYKSVLETEVVKPIKDDPNYTRELYDKDMQLMYRLLNSLDKGTITDKQRVQLLHVQERLAAHRQYEKPIDTRTQQEREESANAGKRILDNMKVVKSFLQAVENSKSALLLGYLINNSPEIIEYINNIGYNLLEGILDADYDSFKKNMERLSDTAKIAQAAKDFNDRYREFTEDPIKLILNRLKIDSKKLEAKQADNQLNKVNNVRNAKVSDLVLQARDGNIDFDAMDDILSLMEEGETKEDVQTKLNEAKAVNQAYNDISEGLLNASLEDTTINPQTIDDALKLLDTAVQSADSIEELKDLDTEAWLDMRNIVGDELDVLEEDLLQRFEDARKLAQSVIDKIKPVKSMGKPTTSTEDTGTTGHDGVTNTKTVNELKKASLKNTSNQLIINDLHAIYNEAVQRLLNTLPLEERQLFADDFKNILRDTEALIILGKDAETIGTTIRNKDTYKRLKAQFPSAIDDLLNYFVVHHPAFKEKSTKVNTQLEPSRKETQLQRGTPTPSTQDSATTEKIQPVIERDTMQGGLYLFIRPYTSLLPFAELSGELKPYYQLLTKVNDKYVDPTGKEYTEEQYKRMKAVYEYLERNGAFDRVNKGAVEPNTKIKFKIDESLNEEAGDVVILITTTDGKVIGDLPPKSASAMYAGLTKLISDIETLYAKDGKITIEATVDKNKVGKVIYDDTYKPLNAVVNGEPLILGIAIEGNRIMIDGGRTKDNKGTRDAVAMPAANATLGQPFIMLKTSDKRRLYIPVPIMMEPFSPSNLNTSIHKAVLEVLDNILQRSARADILKDNLLDLLALEDAYVEYKDNNIKIRIKKLGEDWLTIHNGPVPENISSILDKLYGVPYQVSKKFINGQYRGLNYNQMIGELATTNIPIGATHTVSDWFTIKVPNAKTDSGKSTRLNNHRSEGAFLPLNYDGHKYWMDTKNNFEVYDENNQVYHGEHENMLKAHAWGLHHKLDIDSIWNTPWGNYNPKTGLFVVKQLKPVRNALLELGDDFLQGMSEFTLYNDEMLLAVVLKKEEQQTQQQGTTTEESQKIPLQQLIFDYLDSLPSKDRTAGNIQKKFGIGFNNATQYINEYRTYSLNRFYKDHPNILKVDLNFAGYFEGGGKSIFDDFPDFNKELADKYLNYYLGDGEFTELDAIDFLNEINRIQRLKTQSAANPEIDSLNSEECTLKMIAAGLLNNNIKRMIWNNLSLDALRIIANKAGKPKARQWMDSLSKVFNTRTNSFELNRLPNKPSSVEEYLSSKPKYSKKETDIYEIWDLKKEIKWLKKVLPQLSNDDLLKIHDGLINISQLNGGGQAYGMFWKGVTTIASNAARGTLYHEAFHSVANTLLNDEEYNRLFIAAEEKWGKLNLEELEEKLAEDFRLYVQLEEPSLLGNITRIYRTLKHLIQSLFGMEPYINKIYYNINRGNYANRQMLGTDIERYSETLYSLEEKLILNESIANGTFMKAPNGNPTNLTEKQWLQVRTKAFKDWFGDWQNNPENASKVVDENGEPLVVYRGGTKQGNLESRNGVYYTALSKEYADTYTKQEGGITEALFLNSKTPREIKSTTPIIRSDGKKVSSRGLFENPMSLEDISILMRDNDAVYSEGEYMISNPNQIKSATDNIGSFSRTNNDIRYSRAPQLTIQDLLSIVNNTINNPRVNKTRKAKNIAWGNFKNKWESLGYTIKGYFDESTKKWTVASVSYKQKFRKVEANNTSQYHRDKLALGNLSAEDSQYLNDRKISIEEYNNMSQDSKEVLFHCK